MPIWTGCVIYLLCLMREFLFPYPEYPQIATGTLYLVIFGLALILSGFLIRIRLLPNN